MIKVLFAAILISTGFAAKAGDTTNITVKKVAILPVSFAGEGNPLRMDEMKYRLQNMAFRYLKEKTVELNFQDPAETNALLLKKGITEQNFRQFTPKEITEILGVEYYLTAVVFQEQTVVATQKNTQREAYCDKDGNGREKREQTRTRREMNTTIDMNVYTNSGENIYNKSKQSIWSDADAYKPCLEYLLKRCPLYKK